MSTLPRSALTRYALGSAGMGVYVTVPGLLLLYFLTDTLGVAPWLAGLTLLLPKAADIAVHPLIGALSDRDRAARGDRVRVLLAGCTLAAAFALTFAVPGFARTGQYAAAAWVAIWFTAGNTLFAAYQVPYLATPTDADTDYDGRTRIMSARMVVLTLGILVGGALAPALARHSGGYALMAVVLGLFMAAFQLVGVGGVRRLAPLPAQGAAAPPPTHGRTGAGGAWSVLRANPAFRTLAGAYLLMSTTTHLVLAGLPYFAAYRLGRPGATTVLVASFVAPALVATPLWARFSRRVGKQRCLQAAQIAFAAGCLALLGGAAMGLPVVVAATLVLGAAFAGLQLFPFSMVPDTVREGGPAELDRAGAYAGVWTATEAVGAAAGPYLYSAALAAGGFAASTGGVHPAQSPGARTAVLLGFTVLPAAVMALAALAQRRYRLDSRAAGRPAPAAPAPERAAPQR